MLQSLVLKYFIVYVGYMLFIFQCIRPRAASSLMVGGSEIEIWILFCFYKLNMTSQVAHMAKWNGCNCSFRCKEWSRLILVPCDHSMLVKFTALYGFLTICTSVPFFVMPHNLYVSKCRLNMFISMLFSFHWLYSEIIVHNVPNVSAISRLVLDSVSGKCGKQPFFGNLTKSGSGQISSRVYWIWQIKLINVKNCSLTKC